MSTAERLGELKRELAQLQTRKRERKPTGHDIGGGERGREADHPGEIPPRGWKDVLWRTWNEISDQNLFLIAGGT